MRRISIAALVMLAGCPPKHGPTGPTGESGAGCPPASGVYVVAAQSAEEPEGEAADKPATPKPGHWVLPLHDKLVPTLEGVDEYKAIDATAATEAGVPAPPRNLWLLAPGAAPCKATIGTFYAAAVDSPTPNVTYGVELAGCPAPQDPNATAFALVSETSPTECQLVAPRAAAQRLGEMDKQGAWQRPKPDARPIPDVLASSITAHDCAAPGCEKLYAIGQVDAGGKPVAWGVAVDWLEVPANPSPDTQCEWKSQTFSGIFVAGPSGAPVKLTEGMDHPLALAGLLVDRGGPRVLLATGSGEYTTYAIEGGAAHIGRHVVWYLPHPDSYAAIEQLGPDCTQ